MKIKDMSLRKSFLFCASAAILLAVAGFVQNPSYGSMLLVGFSIGTTLTSALSLLFIVEDSGTPLLERSDDRVLPQKVSEEAKKDS